MGRGFQYRQVQFFIYRGCAPCEGKSAEITNNGASAGVQRLAALVITAHFRGQGW